MGARMKHIVVTGATGFLGSSLIRALVADATELTALARPASDLSVLEGLPVSIIMGDVSLPETLRGIFDGADAVIHAAGMLGRAGVTEESYFSLHVRGTQNVLTELSTSPSPPRLLYISSPGVLGPIAGPPADETTPPAPSNPYERSKAAAEAAVNGYAADGFPAVIVRPEFVYGPRDTHVLGLFRAVARRLFFYVDGGKHTCHPTYIADAVEGILRCLFCGQPGETYHITGPRPITFRELGESLAQALAVPSPRLSLPRSVAMAGAYVLEGLSGLVGREAPLSRTGVAFFSESRRFSWQKAHEQLGYTPSTDFETGCRITVEWYRQHGWL